MARFVDYFVISGYDHTRGHGGGRDSCSQVVQRFPEKDWPDIPFVHGLDRFCQPNGWVLSPERQEPQFFISILTDVEGKRLYCPCLSFSEAVTKESLGITLAADEGEEDPSLGPEIGRASCRERV